MAASLAAIPLQKVAAAAFGTGLLSLSTTRRVTLKVPAKTVEAPVVKHRIAKNQQLGISES
jgi:hypothetical protein